MRAGEEQAIDVLRLQGGADVARTHHQRKDVRGHTCRVQQARNGLTRQDGILGRLVQHRIAGKQRRDEHVAAHEPGVVPGRDVGHHAERDMFDLLGHGGILKHRLGAGRGRHLLQKEIDARQQAVDLVARLLDRLAGFGGGQRRQRVKLGHQRRAKTPDAVGAPGHR